MKKMIQKLKYNQILRSNEPLPVNVNQVIKEVLESISFDFSDIDIELILNFDDTIPVIYIDDNKIKNIIFNLLSNASKSLQKTQRKRKIIVVETSVNALEKVQCVQITVEDNGNGISNEIRDKIFEKGFTMRKNEGGTGLGLYIVREILSSYGGKVYFNSTVGKGTKFYVQIPLKSFLKS